MHQVINTYHDASYDYNLINTYRDASYDYNLIQYIP